MKPTEVDESGTTTNTDGDNYDNESTFESSLEILYGKECEVDGDSIQENTIDSSRNANDRNLVSKDMIEGLIDVSKDEILKINSEHQSDEDMEKNFQNVVQSLAEELNMAAQLIKEEKEQVEKELQSYKELRELFDKISKDYDGSTSLKPKSLASPQDLPKQLRQVESSRHVMLSTPMTKKTMADFSIYGTSHTNPWYYSKCLQDAEKFCDQQMARVRRCISVSSINSHAGDVGQHKPKCEGDTSMDANHDVTGDCIESYMDTNQKQNLNNLTLRQKSPKYLDKKFMGSMERGDCGNEDATFCMRTSTANSISSQLHVSNQLHG